MNDFFDYLDKSLKESIKNNKEKIDSEIKKSNFLQIITTKQIAFAEDFYNKNFKKDFERLFKLYKKLNSDVYFLNDNKNYSNRFIIKKIIIKSSKVISISFSTLSPVSECKTSEELEKFKPSEKLLRLTIYNNNDNLDEEIGNSEYFLLKDKEKAYEFFNELFKSEVLKIRK